MVYEDVLKLFELERGEGVEFEVCVVLHALVSLLVAILVGQQYMQH